MKKSIILFSFYHKHIEESSHPKICKSIKNRNKTFLKLPKYYWWNQEQNLAKLDFFLIIKQTIIHLNVLFNLSRDKMNA